MDLVQALSAASDRHQRAGDLIGVAIERAPAGDWTVDVQWRLRAAQSLLTASLSAIEYALVNGTAEAIAERAASASACARPALRVVQGGTPQKPGARPARLPAAQSGFPPLGRPEKFRAAVMALPTAPKGTGPAGRRLWRELLRVYVLGEHELTVLREAARVADFVARLHDLLEDEGLTDDAGKKHWAIAELRMQRKLLAQLIGSIKIPADVGETAAAAAAAAARDAGDDPDAPRRSQHRGIRGVYPIKLAGGQDR